jgi:hypothetical protein
MILLKNYMARMLLKGEPQSQQGASNATQSHSHFRPQAALSSGFGAKRGHQAVSDAELPPIFTLLNYRYNPKFFEP